MRWLVVFLFLIDTCQAQWVLRADVGARHDLYRVADPGRQLIEGTGLPSIQFGLMGSYYFTERVGVGLGVYRYGLSHFPFSYQSFSGFSSQAGPSDGLWMLSIRADVEVIRFRRFALDAFGGPAYGWMSYPVGLGSTTIGAGVSVPALGVEIRQNDQRYVLTSTAFLLEGGIRLRYRLSHRIDLGLQYLRQVGFDDLVRTDVQYTINGGPEQQASITQRGTGYAWGISVSYRLGESAVW